MTAQNAQISQTVLVVHLGGLEKGPKVLKSMQDLQERGDRVTVLASSETARLYADVAVTVWPDGAPRGILRLLALVRRISWAQFTAIYDFDGSRRTNAYRWCVRPRPPWHACARPWQ